MTDLAVANQSLTGMQKIKNYMLSPEVKERFSEMMGPNALYYLNQVLILVASDEKLQACSPKSILIAAMRAASLRLSVDKSKGQAWIIPYKNEATFQLGYKGVYDLAMRTNQYRFINVIPVYEGETITENRMTGMQEIQAVGRTGDKVIGWMLYFQLVKGFEKTFYMTAEEIEQHARHYSQAYQYDLKEGKHGSKWSDPYERPKMEKKTVLVNGLRQWGVFNDNDVEILDSIEADTGFIDRLHELPAEDEVSKIEAPKHTEKQNLSALGFGDPEPAPPAKVSTSEAKTHPEPDTTFDFDGDDNPNDGHTFADSYPPEEIVQSTGEVLPPTEVMAAMARIIGNRVLGDYSPDELQAVVENKRAADSLRKSAAAILAWRNAQPALI